MDRDAPLGCTFDYISYECELVAVAWRRLRSERVVKVNGIATQLVRPDSSCSAICIELGAVDGTVLGAAEILERGVSEIDIGP